MKNIYIYIFLAYNYFNRRFDCLLCWLYFFLFFFLKKNRRTHLNKQLIYGEWILVKKKPCCYLVLEKNSCPILIHKIFNRFLYHFIPFENYYIHWIIGIYIMLPFYLHTYMMLMNYSILKLFYFNEPYLHDYLYKSKIIVS